MMAADLPVGLLAARLGDKPLMILASLLMAAAFAGLALAPGLWMVSLATLVLGAASSAFLLARMSHLAAACPAWQRGRVIAMLAGIMRISTLLGPLAGGYLAEVAGFGAVFAAAALASLGGGLVVLVSLRAAPHAGAATGLHGILRVARAHGRNLLSAGSAAVAIMLMRAGRTLLLPLMGAALGLTPTAVGVIVALSAVADVALFYPAGQLLDRLGRRRVAIPGSLALALGIGALAVVSGPLSLALVATLVGIANGLTTGIVMTLGTDLAPRGERGAFLGLWRLLGDFGMAAGPLLVSAVATAAPLGLAALAVSAVGLLGTWTMWRFVPETLPAQTGRGE